MVKLLALSLSSALLVLLVFEAGLRIASDEPRKSRPLVLEMPRMTDPDPELGWVSRPGSYRYRHSDRTIQITIRPDGSRGATGGGESAREIWFFGCSYTQGWGLTDGEEFAAIVARRAPGWTVRNFGVAGYSTLQAQLLYERLVEELPTKPQLVVYGYAGFHEYRNTAAPNWLFSLTRIAGENEWIELPYARWDAATGLRTFPPKRWKAWPLSEYSALLQLVSYRVAVLADAASPDEQRQVTLALLDRWQRRVDQEGGRFLTMLLAARPKIANSLPAALEARSVPYLGCLNSDFPSPETRLSDGHPNEIVHASWADCFSDWLEAR